MGEPCDLMIALHARRSAQSVADWRATRGDAPLVVVLTGTDLYRDIESSAEARASLAAADRLVVLNELGARMLPEGLRRRTGVILQSSPGRAAVSRTPRHLRALMVGHLREEKSPRTYFEAVRALARRDDILFDHIGAPLDDVLGREALALMQECPRYRWLGNRPHGETLRRIQHAHVLVHASRMEGGAHVVLEAVRCHSPVLASRIDGNVGLLGSRYAGYFATGDAAGLAALIGRCRDTQGRDNGLLTRLTHQCAARRDRFAPQAEAMALNALVARLLRRR